MEINVNDIKLGVIGCGKMASAILNAVYTNKFISDIYVYDINASSSRQLSDKYGFKNSASIDELLQETNALLIATKPFVVNDVLSSIKTKYKNHLVMSILAGVKLEKYYAQIPEIKIVRIMPNTPALVNMGMSAICAGKNVDRAQVDFVYKFMKNCGEVVVEYEDKMDIITALSGSGPAYYYKIIELMAKAAEKLGLNEREAMLLSAQTALGSAKMVIENNFDTNTLIKNVTTPGGCTEVGNNVINSSDIDKIIDKVIKDTMEKAVRLG